MSVSDKLELTAKRVDWATTVCKGKKANNIEAGAVHYIAANVTFGGKNENNSFTHLDKIADGTLTTADCICLANMAATALRFNHVDARPARAWAQNKVVAATNTTWGWEPKQHMYNAGWYLGYPGNNFEGFLHIGEFKRWTNFPTRGLYGSA